MKNVCKIDIDYVSFVSLKINFSLCFLQNLFSIIVFIGKPVYGAVRGLGVEMGVGGSGPLKSTL